MRDTNKEITRIQSAESVFGLSVIYSDVGRANLSFALVVQYENKRKMFHWTYSRIGNLSHLGYPLVAVSTGV